MTPEEENEWEEHYFECDECLGVLEEAVAVGKCLREEARANIESQEELERRMSWVRIVGLFVRPFPCVSALSLAAVVVVAVRVSELTGWMKPRRLEKELRLPVVAQGNYHLQRVRDGDRYRTQEPAGAVGTLVAPPPSGGPLLLDFNILDVAEESSEYRAMFANQDNVTIWTGRDLRGQGPYGTFAILCWSSLFGQGDYEFRVEEVRTTDSTILSRFRFPFQVVTED